MNFRRLIALTLSAGALAQWAAAPAAANDVHCPPHLGASVVDGNVLVAAPCELRGTTVKGNVHVYAGGSLIAHAAHINGNIQAENAFEIDVENSEVGGSIQLDGLVGESSRIAESRIDGSIQLEGNRSAFLIDRNVVGADIQAFGNMAAIDIVGNVVDGNLQCKSNSPAPTGGDNAVHGNKEDQCVNLEPADAAGAPTGGTSGNGGALPGEQAQPRSSGGGGSSGIVTLLALLGFAAARRRS